MDDDQREAEAVHLTQRGFYLPPLSRPLDLNKAPSSGTEYLHLVRMEAAAEDARALTSTQKKDSCNAVTVSKNDIHQWKRTEAKYFSHLASQLKSKKRELKKKFPNKVFPPINDEKGCCTFCLGSDVCKEIYNSKVEEFAKGHSPLLSIVLHMSQKDVETLLKYHHEWFKVIGMKDYLCRWIYALLACLQKPLKHKFQTFLEMFFDDCIKKCKENIESEKYQLHLISSLLENYFCVKAHMFGPSLEELIRATKLFEGSPSEETDEKSSSEELDLPTLIVDNQ